MVKTSLRVKIIDYLGKELAGKLRKGFSLNSSVSLWKVTKNVKWIKIPSYVKKDQELSLLLTSSGLCHPYL